MKLAKQHHWVYRIYTCMSSCFSHWEAFVDYETSLDFTSACEEEIITGFSVWDQSILPDCIWGNLWWGLVFEVCVAAQLPAEVIYQTDYTIIDNYPLKHVNIELRFIILGFPFSPVWTGCTNWNVNKVFSNKCRISGLAETWTYARGAVWRIFLCFVLSSFFVLKPQLLL